MFSDSLMSRPATFGTPRTCEVCGAVPKVWSLSSAWRASRGQVTSTVRVTLMGAGKFIRCLCALTFQRGEEKKQGKPAVINLQVHNIILDRSAMSPFSVVLSLCFRTVIYEDAASNGLPYLHIACIQERVRERCFLNAAKTVSNLRTAVNTLALLRG